MPEHLTPQESDLVKLFRRHFAVAVSRELFVLDDVDGRIRVYDVLSGRSLILYDRASGKIRFPLHKDTYYVDSAEEAIAESIRYIHRLGQP